MTKASRLTFPWPSYFIISAPMNRSRNQSDVKQTSYDRFIFFPSRDFLRHLRKKTKQTFLHPKVLDFVAADASRALRISEALQKESRAFILAQMFICAAFLHLMLPALKHCFHGTSWSAWTPKSWIHMIIRNSCSNASQPGFIFPTHTHLTDPDVFSQVFIETWRIQTGFFCFFCCCGH